MIIYHVMIVEKLNKTTKDFISELPSIAWIKDFNGIYRAMSSHTVPILQYTREDQIVGKSDFDVQPLFAEQWQDEDNFIMKGNLLTRTATPKLSNNSVTCILNTTKPYYQRGKLIGTLGVGQEISANLPDTALNDIRRSLGKDLVTSFSHPKRKHYDYHHIRFTKREAQIVSYLLRGYSAPAIAEKLFISIRTAESHIRNIKSKCGYNKKTDLFENAIKYGFIELLFMP